MKADFQDVVLGDTMSLRFAQPKAGNPGLCGKCSAQSGWPDFQELLKTNFKGKPLWIAIQTSDLII